MVFLVGGILAGIEIIGTGVLLKIGGHLGKQFLSSCGEDARPSSRLRMKDGKSRALEDTAGEDAPPVT